MTASEPVSSKDRIVVAAERLFAERGLDGVSLREINRTAKCRNATAIQYHFTNKEGLIWAVLNRHVPDIEQGVHELLDAYESDANANVRELAGALVLPYADKLETQSGRHFLQVYAAALNQPTPMVLSDRSPAKQEPSEAASNTNEAHDEGAIDRWRRLADPLMDEDAVVLHRRFSTITFVITELGRRSRVDKTNHQLFTSMLTDSAAAVLAAPTSESTRALLERRLDRKPS